MGYMRVKGGEWACERPWGAREALGRARGVGVWGWGQARGERMDGRSR